MAMTEGSRIKLSKISKFISNKSITRIISQRINIPEKYIILDRKFKCDHGYISLMASSQEQQQDNQKRLEHLQQDQTKNLDLSYSPNITVNTANMTDTNSSLSLSLSPSIISLLDGFSPRRESENESLSLSSSTLSSKLFQVDIEKNDLISASFDSSIITAKRSLNDQVTPLWKLPYKDQLIHKESCAKSKLASFMITNDNNNKKTDNQDQGQCQDGFIMEPIIASPTINGYRNKCEFSIGWDSNGHPTVGFLLGSYKEGITFVHKPDECLHIPDSLKLLASRMQSLVEKSISISNSIDGNSSCSSSSSPIFSPYNRKTRSGLWRLLLCRIHGGKIMTVVQIHSPSPSLSLSSPSQTQQSQSQSQTETRDSEMIVRIKQELQDTFKGFTDSLFLQETSQMHVGIDYNSPFQLLMGPPVLYEELCGLKFRTSPLSFIQVNSMAAEKLYLKCKEYVHSTYASTLNDIKEETVNSLQKEKKRNAILLDLCCGTGTIGIIMASQVRHVIGIDIIPQAIEDAKQNAIINNVDNIEFHCGPVEKLLPSILNDLQGRMEKIKEEREGEGEDSSLLDKCESQSQPSLIVVLDPPRAGVHKSLIKLLKNNYKISQIVFISCDLNGSMNNLVSLVTPSSLRKLPFTFTGKRNGTETNVTINDKEDIDIASKDKEDGGIGTFFKLEKAAIIDMFPHTNHYEMIFSLVRSRSDSQ